MARFANTIDNQPIYAARAEADKNGDRIDTTYAKLTDIPDVPVQDVEVDGTSVVNAQGVAEITLPTFTQEQANWTESDSSDPSFIQNKPNVKPVVAGSNVQITEDANSFTISATDTTYTAGNNITISGGVISATAEPQVQADWTESDSTSKAYIQHKPDLSVYAQSSSLAAVATTGDYDDLINKPSIPAAQVNSDWNASSGVAQILNKPNLATVATSGNYNDLSNLPTIPPAVTVDQHYDALSSNPQSGTAVAEALSGTGQVPTVTSSDDSKVLMASYSGGQGSYSWQPTAAATQVNSDWEATSGVAEILHKPDLSVYAETADLATVATTGSYNDLSDKPSIPAAQVNADWNASSGVAQILNKPTIPAAQVQSNWTEADSTSKAYIQNKPDLSVYAQSSSLATVATTGDYDDLVDAPTIVGLAAGANVTITEANNTVTIAATDTTYTAGTGISISGGAISNSDPIPSHTSTQSGQVLGVDSNGDLDWVTPAASQVQANWNESDSSSPAFIQNKPTIPSVDQTYNALSTNAQSGTAVAGALSNISQVPPTSQASAGDVLTVDQYGDATWVTPSAQAQVQSDWTESDPTDMAYIQHKPNQKPLVAGQNVVLTEGANNITIDCTASGGGSTYTAGNGISISAQDVISVDTSVVATQTDLAGKQNTLTAGTNVSIVNNVISATDTTYTAGDGIAINANAISAKVGGGIKFGTAAVPSTTTEQLYMTADDMSNCVYGFGSVSNSATALNNGDTVSVELNYDFSVHRIQGTNGTYYAAIAQFANKWGSTMDGEPYLILGEVTPSEVIGSEVYFDEGLSVDYNINDISTSLSNNLTWSTVQANPGSYQFGIIYIWEQDAEAVKYPDTSYSYEPLNTATATIPTTVNVPNSIILENPLPASTVADSSKVLTVDANGSPSWASAQAPISAGNGIDITNNVVSVDTSVVATQTDLADKEDAFDVGTGLEMDTSGATPTLQVEAPVDIVAGPGIVIDNPDGNTLRVSTDENYETVLWSGSPTASVTLSESMNNFEFIDVYERWDNDSVNATVHRIYLEGKTSAVLNFSIGTNSWYLVVQKLSLNGTSLSVSAVHAIHGSTYTSTDIVHESNTTLLKNTIVKVVGIHRIANN